MKSKFLNKEFLILITKTVAKWLFWTMGIVFVGSLVAFLGKEEKINGFSDMINFLKYLTSYDYSLILLSTLGGLLLDYTLEINKENNLYKISFSFLPFVFLMIFLAILKGKKVENLYSSKIFSLWNILSLTFVSYLKALMLLNKEKI